MKYVSTRGQAPSLEFADVVMTGLARDGGLYVPENWPRFSEVDLASLEGLSYPELAFRVLTPFVGDDIQPDAFRKIVDDAYSGFHHRLIAPLRQIGPSHWLLELFHGPTLAFKDVAMQLIGPLLSHFLRERKQRATIIGATSGDTGSAAIEALRGREGLDVFIFHPKGRVSEVQRRQMTTVLDDNIHNIALDGNFDDAQAIVKALFNDEAFRDERNLSAVNSINWARIMAQCVYYFSSSIALGATERRRINYSVPTGNFGDIYAGYAAQKMGAFIGNLTIATNVNDILARCVNTGRYEVHTVTPTMSPSMDIQVSSNFERLLFAAGGGDAKKIVRHMESLRKDGAFVVDNMSLSEIRKHFTAVRADERATSETMKRIFRENQYLLDPHTAVGVTAEQEQTIAGPTITLATAHPAKFPAAVKEATGVEPILPSHMEDLFEREERFDELANDVSAVKDFIRGRSTR